MLVFTVNVKPYSPEMEGLVTLEGQHTLTKDKTQEVFINVSTLSIPHMFDSGILMVDYAHLLFSIDKRYVEKNSEETTSVTLLGEKLFCKQAKMTPITGNSQEVELDLLYKPRGIKETKKGDTEQIMLIGSF